MRRWDTERKKGSICKASCLTLSSRPYPIIHREPLKDLMPSEETPRLQPSWAPKEKITAPLSSVAPPTLQSNWLSSHMSGLSPPQLLLLSQPETTFPSPAWTTLPLPSSLCSALPLGRHPRHLCSDQCLSWVSTVGLARGESFIGSVSISPSLLLSWPWPFPNRPSAPQASEILFTEPQVAQRERVLTQVRV